MSAVGIGLIGRSKDAMLTTLFWLLLGHAFAQENSWTNAVSGNWAEPYWSLGALPNSNQTVLFTNAGWKALTLDSSTAAVDLESLTVNAIRIASSTNSFNTLLLDYLGYQMPLTANSLVIGSNSAVVILQSALEVNASGTSAFSVNGTFTETEDSLVEAPYMSIGELGDAVLNLTNSTLRVPVEFFGGAFRGTIHHASGYNLFDSLHLNNADYRLYGGSCIGDIVIGDYLSASFHQFAGSVTGKVAIAHGSYFLDGGDYASAELIIPAVTYSTSGSFVQSGGTNRTGSLTVGAYYGGWDGSYELSGGLLNTTNTYVSYYGAFQQSGGLHLVHGELNVSGGIVLKGGGAVWATYGLTGGRVSSDSLSIVVGIFSQNGGTNRTGDLILGPHYAESTYNMSGGRLEAANTIVHGSWTGGLYLTGGTLVVSNLFNLSGEVYYRANCKMTNGDLIARDIQISRGTFQHLGGTVTHSGVLTLADGIWDESDAEQQLGGLQLNGGETNSVIRFSGASGILRFAPSSGLVWSINAVLVIKDWNGSTLGGGDDQLIFGSDATGLASSQLSQIRFQDPANFPPGLYPARILASGEVVPGPFLSFGQMENALELQWSGGLVLQSATNAAGPYHDVLGALSPYTNRMTEAQRFFRLRQ